MRIDREVSATGVVLIATPEPAAAAQLRSEIERLGHRVVVASTIVTAIAEVHGFDFDLAIVALEMPPRGGAALVRVARLLEAELPIAVLLPSGRDDAPLECVRQGAFDFLRQPITPSEVVSVVERALRRRQQRTTTAMFRASHAVVTGADPCELPRVIAEMSAELVPCDGVAIFHRDAHGAIVVGHGVGFAEASEIEPLLAFTRTALERNPGGAPLVLPDEGHELVELPPAAGIRSVIIYPIVLGGEVTCVIALERRTDPRLFRRAEVQRVGVLAAQLRLALENRQLLDAQVANERLAAVGQLAAGVAHEINSPLQFVLANAEVAVEMLREDPGSIGEVVEMLADVQEGARRIADIARDLRTLARGANEAEIFDLRDAVQSAVRVASPSWRGVLDVRLDLTAEALVRGHPGRISQVFVNLLVNAAQAAAGTKQLVGVTVTLRAGESTLEVVVQDEGPGIAPEHLSRIFDAYFTTKSSRTGTGLGLSIARATLLEHGGSLEVESELGEGTRFVVVLPRALGAGRSRAPRAA